MKITKFTDVPFVRICFYRAEWLYKEDHPETAVYILLLKEAFYIRGEGKENPLPVITSLPYIPVAAEQTGVFNQKLKITIR